MDHESAMTPIKWIISIIGTVATYLWGGWDAVLVGLFALVTMDYISGMASAAKRGVVNSNVGWWGIAKKAGIFMIVAACHVADQAMMDRPVLRTGVALAYSMNELTSLVENLGELGVWVPKRLRQAIAVLRNKEGGD